MCHGLSYASTNIVVCYSPYVTTEPSDALLTGAAEHPRLPRW